MERRRYGTSTRAVNAPITITPMFNIEKDGHELVGVKTASVRGFYTGGHELPIRRCVVIHYTEGTHGDTSLDFWKNDPKCIKDDIGAHILIERDGTVRQCRAFNRTISHAGTSHWRDPRPGGTLYHGLNRCAIGIELANTGNEVQRIRGEEKIPGYAGLLENTRHANGGNPCTWEKYSDAQVAACIAVCQALKARYNIDDIVGHDCIAPERKIDPGPAFPMLAVREACQFTGLPIVFQI